MEIDGIRSVEFKLGGGGRAAVDVVPFVVTYNGMATGPCIKRCVEYLMSGAPPSFGILIERVDIYAHCQTRDPINPGLASMHERFQDRLATLPFLRLRRSPRLFEVSYASQLLHSGSMFRAEESVLPTVDFRLVCREFADALSSIRRRVKRSDGFDIDGLDEHLRRRLESLG
jgi:hypothetical protein